MQKEGRIFLISKLPWCHARRFFKLAGEVRNILEAAGDGNVADAHFALCEKLLGASNPAVDDVVDERTSRVFFEEMGQIIGVQIHHGRKRIAIQLVGEVRFDICLHGGNSRVLGSNGNLAAEGFVFAARMIHLAKQQLQELIVKAGQKFPCSSAGAFRLI